MLQINEDNLFEVVFDFYMIYCIIMMFDAVGQVISCICLSWYFIHTRFCL